MDGMDVDEKGGPVNRIRAWEEVVYRERQAKLKMNDLSSETFLLTRGIHQGCPLSPLLFDICVAALLVTV